VDADALANCRISGHKAAQLAAGRVQLCNQAGQASCTASVSKPGKSDHGTGTQRLLACVMTGGMGSNGPWRGRGAVVDGLAVDDRVGSGSSNTGATEQAMRLPTMMAIKLPETVRWQTENGNVFMTLILLEALLALLLFVVIVWWTMFSGRKNGELPPAEQKDLDDKAP